MFHVKLLFLIIFPLSAFCQHLGTTTLESKSLPPLPNKKTDIYEYINQFPSSAKLSTEEREWFYWTNLSRSNPRQFWDSIITPVLNSFPTLKNAYSSSLKKELYESIPLPLLKPNVNLQIVSCSFAKEMASKSASPSHTSPSGLTFANRMAVAGIKICAGENISFGPGNPLMMLILLYIDQGVPELGHRKALLSATYTDMGIGISKYPDNTVIVIQDLSCDQK